MLAGMMIVVWAFSRAFAAARAPLADAADAGTLLPDAAMASR
jgi:hypothetical protein